jgi:hypothetical protein
VAHQLPGKEIKQLFRKLLLFELFEKEGRLTLSIKDLSKAVL